jgi:fluoroacetyl-CoA thioesterase
MKQIAKPGDKTEFRTVVSPNDFAAFNGKIVHQVLSTFALARDMEWTTRLFVLEICEADEEGIGTFVHVDHRSPAFAAEEIVFVGNIEEINGNELICSVTARVGERLIALGKTGQKILKREMINQLLTKK